MRRLDRRGRVTFVDIAREAQCPKDRTAMLLRLHAREKDGDIVTGAAAFAAMWRAMPLLQPLGMMARTRPVLWLLELSYDGFLHVRPALQRGLRLIEAGFAPPRRRDGA
jgi:predicted DCC family thiol-disulfide oxidoreductase YuxK